MSLFENASEPLKIFDGSTTDTYQYLRCPGTRRLLLQVTNAQVYIGYGTLSGGGGSAVYPPNDEPFLPVIGSIERECDEVRIKSYIPGTPAKVIIRALDY